MSSLVDETPKIPMASVAPRMEAPKNPGTVTPEFGMEMKPAAPETGTDFKEDPFQNYRYEDPFLISDPFQDEEASKPEPVKEPVAVFKGK